MGDCRFCHKPAGFLRKQHKECAEIYNAGVSEIRTEIAKAANSGDGMDMLKQDVQAVAATHFMTQEDLKNVVVSSWEHAVSSAFDDGVLTEEEESNLVEVQKAFSLTQDDLNKHGAFAKVVKGNILRQVLDGNIPELLNVQGGIPFNLQKGEKLIWLFQGARYYEQKTRRHIEGRSSGVSIRIAKGVYYRTGGFKGYPVETTENVHVGTGILGITSKHIYFASSSKSLRVPFGKIVSVEPYSDGIEIQRDAMTAKPQTFIIDDGWFAYNLVTNLSQL